MIFRQIFFKNAMSAAIKFKIKNRTENLARSAEASHPLYRGVRLQSPATGNPSTALAHECAGVERYSN
jgi:hypothetical protein